MRKEYLEAGKAVGTHGVRGMIRIQPWSDDAEFLSGFKAFYIGEEKKPLRVLRIQPHGRIAIAALKGIDSIEAAEGLRNKILYIKRDEANLPKDRYFVSELIGCEVFNAENGSRLGRLCDVSQTGANDVWHIENERGEFLVPAIDEVIVSVDIDAERIEIKLLKGIMDDEN